jgi:hypothetical protein
VENVDAGKLGAAIAELMQWAAKQSATHVR